MYRSDASLLPYPIDFDSNPRKDTADKSTILTKRFQWWHVQRYITVAVIWQNIHRIYFRHRDEYAVFLLNSLYKDNFLKKQHQ